MILEDAFRIKWLPNMLECYLLITQNLNWSAEIGIQFTARRLFLLPLGWNFTICDVSCDTIAHGQFLVPRTAMEAAPRCQAQHLEGKLFCQYEFQYLKRIIRRDIFWNIFPHHIICVCVCVCVCSLFFQPKMFWASFLDLLQSLENLWITVFDWHGENLANFGKLF